jgi:porin
MTGDWGGARQELMDHGLRFDLSLTQILQRNLAGGRDYRCAYTGGADFGLKLDTGKAGLWPGGLLSVKGEAHYGKSSNLDTGVLMPVNTDALYPNPGEDLWALSELSYTQFLATWIGVTVGKFSPRNANVFSHDETEQFMNGALCYNPVVSTTVPLSFLGAGVIVLPANGFMLSTFVFDTEGVADDSGFPTVWQRGTSLMQQGELTVKPFGLTGHQRVGWSWSDKERIQLSQTPRQIIHAIRRGNTEGLSRQGSDCAFFYDFDQYVYLVPGSKDRGVGLFGRFGCTDGEVNPVEQFYSLGVSGKGLVPGRERDTFGVGYYYVSTTDDLPRRLQRRVDDTQGVEVYYNVAVTPWLHVTPDLQVLDPAFEGVDTTWVAGLRVKVIF